MTRLLRLTALILWAAFWGPAIAAPAGVEASNEDGPALAFGLSGISDWSTEHPFLDFMKSARPWIGHLPGQWGGMDTDELWRAGYLDAEGWPVALPPGVEKLGTLLLTDQPKEAEHLSGIYVVLFDGKGKLNVTGRGRIVSRSPGRVRFDYRPGPGHVQVEILETDRNDPIRNIRVYQERYEPLARRGELFNPDWLDRLRPVRAVRFMDWMRSNDSHIVSWESRPRVSDFSYAWRGVPVEAMVRLANELAADPWFCIPHRADDAFVRQFAETVKASLEPRRKVFVEYSNEVWNFIFGQAHWARDRAEALWGGLEDGWMQYYGLRAAQVMAIWSKVYGTEAQNRLVRVMAVHTGWPGLEAAALHGIKARDALGAEPAVFFDAYAVTGYFGHELSDPAVLQPILSQAAEQAKRDGEARGLRRVALRSYVEAHRFEGVNAEAAEVIRAGSLSELTRELWPYHARMARANDLRLIMYEGGTHAAAQEALREDEAAIGFLSQFNYSEEMGALYEAALSAWQDVGGEQFNAFVDVAAPSKWGSWGALRHLNDTSPRWRALRSYNKEAASGWDERGPSDFVPLHP